MPVFTARLVTDGTRRLAVQATEPGGTAAATSAEYALYACDQPTCSCRVVALQAMTELDGQQALPEKFDLDPFERAAVGTREAPAPGVQQAIAAAIDDADWRRLRTWFLAAKAEAIAAMDPDHDYAEFPIEEIERERVLVAFRQILPFAPELGPAGDAAGGFAVDDHYCVRRECDCADVVLTLYAVDADGHPGHELAALEVDLRRDTWTTAENEQPLDADATALRDRLRRARPDLLVELERRRRFLRRLYAASSPSLGPRQPVRAAPRTGRNDPCPCGSGKKAKKCCQR